MEKIQKRQIKEEAPDESEEGSNEKKRKRSDSDLRSFRRDLRAPGLGQDSL